MRAPADGMVLSVLSEGSALVPEGTELMQIGNPGDIEVVVDLLSRDAVRVKPGARVEFTQWGGDRPLAGRVKRIEPLGRMKVSALGIEEQRVDVIIGFAPDADGDTVRLGHGFQTDATIELWRSPSVLRVPIGALFRGGNGSWRVFAIESGRARQRMVAIGHINDELGEVLGGLGEGAWVILNPGNLVSEGRQVRPR